ncbi:hypothetical protein UFOVP1537_48 [uncultured Caudovirales phage]|uniref:Uncharacterized protein n=2 Tax=root TaxID=1 RepID=A0A6J5QYN9_9CAUD|nr:hypothetical protein UFOVP825_13 [uncultured Caudovirales phage]CAB4171335.1 hypothetical protein UFOVP915_48 [uncultured Caudovirales phage]CAB4177195.1 hypothetical protein UFOVP1000_12 [uncultured Caudovirales phage]CAB4183166.1 hypothetical protein UFOVP1092_40 [uncultured Caudovirales phage]CAB4187677.1 hypothetical protein UFOVP1152_44 [uncultured Caudovirales phage]
MKQFDFLPGAKSYELLQQASTFSTLTLTPPDYRVLAKMQDKLEAVGKPEADEENPKVTVYVATGETLILEDAEVELLKKMFDKVCWTAAVARDVVSAMDLLTNAPEFKLKKVE